MNRWVAVVDDDAIGLTSAKNMLGEENMKVSCLRSGSDLLKFIRKNVPDLILLDILMPDMDGFETYHALRETEDQMGRPHIPVIFLTGEDDSAVERRGLEIGASDFIRKPLNKDVMVRRIENTITNRNTIQTLTKEAMFDDLTGFLNKTRGTERLAKLCSRKTGALIIFDLDSFKLVNDLFGHDMGDKVLKSFADILRRNTRETDTISRIGGDEFLAFYEDLTQESTVASITLRLNTQLRDEAVILMGEDHGIPLGISVGAVMVPEQGRDYDKLFTMADDALYTVKKNGKHGYYIYSQKVDSDEEDISDPEEKLERIIRIVEERNDNGEALLLGSDSFALIYRFIMRFYKRYGGTAALLLFTLSMEEDGDNLKLLDISEQFCALLQKTLRMSDIMMRNGSNSFFVLLTERTRAEADGAINRILDIWDKTEHFEGARISHTFKYINPSGYTETEING